MMPNDEKEQERLDLAHHIFKLLLRGHLHRVPLSSPPRHVLDFGTGTGSWAIDFADTNPDSLVLGIDLSPIQPSNIPPNCRFFVDDAESPWTFESKFDFIHGRAMAGSIKDWESLLQQAFDNMNDGAVIELQEYEALYKSDDNSLSRTPAIRRWQHNLNEASERYVPNISPARFRYVLVSFSLDRIADQFLQDWSAYELCRDDERAARKARICRRTR